MLQLFKELWSFWTGGTDHSPDPIDQMMYGWFTVGLWTIGTIGLIILIFIVLIKIL